MNCGSEHFVITQPSCDPPVFPLRCAGFGDRNHFAQLRMIFLNVYFLSQSFINSFIYDYFFRISPSRSISGHSTICPINDMNFFVFFLSLPMYDSLIE